MKNRHKKAKPKNTALPETGFLRVNQIVGDKQYPALVPVSRSSWWAGVKSGRYPAAIKLGPRTTAWRVSDIRALIECESDKAA